jgi:hypothetical protein
MRETLAVAPAPADAPAPHGLYQTASADWSITQRIPQPSATASPIPQVLREGTFRAGRPDVGEGDGIHPASQSRPLLERYHRPRPSR